MKLTVKVKLLPTTEQKTSLVKTIEVFNEACNYISYIAFDKKTFGQIGLHHLVYHDVRAKFKLPAQMAIRAIGKVSESYKAEKRKLHIFKKHSAIVYDQRVLSFKGLDTVSILSLDGRLKIPIVFGSYAKLEQRRVRGQADLLYHKGNLYLCLVVELPDGTLREVNIYGEGRKNGKGLFIIGEAKAQMSKKDIDGLLRLVGKLSSLLKKEILPIGVTYSAPPDVERYARDKGVRLY
ncbi:MAG: hypothetical protein AAB922_00020, partial [Patescibacteria group bacterium]